MAQNKTFKEYWKRDLSKLKKEIHKFNGKDYLKSIYANKVTLAGIGLYATALSINTFFFQNNDGTNPLAEVIAYSSWASSYLLGLACLGGTAFGKTTYETYTKTKKMITKEKQIPKKTIDSCLNLYCNTVGLNLARKEAGLEPLVGNHFLD